MDKIDNLVYPAIFHKEGGGYWVEFPDLPGCLSEGNSAEDALLMAGDALYGWLSSVKDAPSPSHLDAIQVSGNSFVQMVRPAIYVSEEAKQYAISEAIETGLEERHLNKNQAAIILDVDRSYFTHLVTGKKKPSPEMAKRIALLLGFDWQVFFA